MNDLYFYALSIVSMSLEFWAFVASLAIAPGAYKYLGYKITSPARRFFIIGGIFFLSFFYITFRVWQTEYHLRLAAEQILASLKEEAKQVPFLPEKIETFPNEQAKKLTLSAAKQRDDLSPLLVGIFGSQNMAYGLGVVDAFRSAGVKTSDARISPDTAQQSGILISCDTSEHAEKKRAALASVLEDAGLHYRETEMISEAKAYGVNGCFLYLGPTEK